MIFVNHYAIRPAIPKTILAKPLGSKSWRFLSCSFTEIVFSISTAFSVSNSRLHICSNSASCHNVFIQPSLSGVTNLSLLAGVCAACVLAYRCLQMKWWAAVTVVAIPSQKAQLMCPYVSSGKFSVLAPRCSRTLLHNLLPTSDCCLIFASHLATGMIPAIAIIFRLSCLQGTRGSFKYFLKNALLSFSRNMKSSVQRFWQQGDARASHFNYLVRCGPH